VTAATKRPSAAAAPGIGRWTYPVDLSGLDRDPELSERERHALATLDW
jgi:hypothetical protein